MQDEAAFIAIQRMVRQHWRRRFLIFAHLLLYIVTWSIPFSTQTIREVAADGSAYTWTLTQHGLPYPQMIAWGAMLAVHVIWAIFAELRDRATRREIERERKWRLLERLDDYDPYLRERALRLAEIDDGELLDLETIMTERELKRKRS